MVIVEASSKPITEQKTTTYTFLVPEDFSPALFKSVDKKFGAHIVRYLKKHDFIGKVGETVALPLIKDEIVYHIVVVGLGKRHEKKGIAIESLRRALGVAYKKVASFKETSFALVVPPAADFHVDVAELGKQIVTMLNIVGYRFHEFFSDKDKKEKEIEITNVFVTVNAKQVKALQQGITDGGHIARAVNKARRWIDLPPSHLTPPQLAEKAKEIAAATGLALTIFEEKEIIQKGMGGLAAVGRGSDHESRFVILEYKAPKKDAPTIAFVGKGITFDSGGLSIKPALSMETMKEDMSGAAAVLVALEALARLKPDVHVIGVAPLAENLPSGKATKPGDIVQFYNGKTAEVKNTDAEGRLILADALSYVTKHYKPDAIVDIATLTGACAAALGPFYSGLMSCHDELVEKIMESGHRAGDHVWRLPLNDDYAAAIRSDVADLSNIGSQRYMAGAVTAAYFLKQFVHDTPWAHLDIAGTAFNVPDIPYYRTGATGVGVRLLVDLAMNWK